MLKRENKIAIISFILSVALMCVLGYLIITFIPNNLDVEEISNKYAHALDAFTAEKSETIAYASITVLFPISFIAIYQILNKTKLDMESNIIKVIIGTFIFTLIIITLKIAMFDTYFIERSLLYDNLIAFLIIFVAFLMAIILYQRLKNDKIKKIFKVTLYTLALCAILVTSYMSINNSYAQSLIEAHHFDAYFYPVYKIASGLTPGIDFNSLYGYYSYFFSFMLKLLGGVSIIKFSYIVTALILFAFSLFAIFSNKLIKNKVLWLIVVLVLLYLFMIEPYSMLGYIALQRIPHRIVFISLILVYMLIYNKFRDKHTFLNKAIGVIICTLSLIWNLETGVVVFGTWIMFQGYEILYFNSLKEKKTYIEIAKVFLEVVLTILLYFVILNTITFIRTRRNPWN